MASKLASVLVILVLCHICLSVRMTRDTTAESKSKDSSSESPEENFDKLVADLGEKLGPKENKELKQIMDGLRSAKTNEQEIGAYIKMVEFGVKTMTEHSKDESTSTYPPTTTTPASTTTALVYD